MKEEQRQKHGNRDREMHTQGDREGEGGGHTETNWQRDRMSILIRFAKDKVELCHVVHFVISKP